MHQMMRLVRHNAETWVAAASSTHTQGLTRLRLTIVTTCTSTALVVGLCHRVTLSWHNALSYWHLHCSKSRCQTHAEVLDELSRVLPQLAIVDGLTTALEQQQLVKSLQVDAVN